MLLWSSLKLQKGMSTEFIIPADIASDLRHGSRLAYLKNLISTEDFEFLSRLGIMREASVEEIYKLRDLRAPLVESAFKNCYHYSALGDDACGTWIEECLDSLLF